MKVLFVLGGKVSALHKENDKNSMSFFIKEQSDGLLEKGIDIDFYKFNLGSKFSIFRKIKELREILKSCDYDLIHAHYGLFGFASLFGKGNTPLITTFHGSDINLKPNRVFSSLAIKFSSYSIFVSQSLYDNSWIKPSANFDIIPCGLDKKLFFPMPKYEARDLLNFKKERIYILFPSRKSNPIKNFDLAKKALDLLDFDYELVELIKKSREEVNIIMNACDLIILTSFSEGSPQVIKEALATNLPIVSVNVGDVKENIKEVRNCFIAENEAPDIAEKIKIVVSNNCQRTDGAIRSGRFDNNVIVEKLISVYKKVLL